MFAKVLAISALVAYAQANVNDLGHQSHASSYSSVNQHLSAPIAAYQSAPLAYAHAPVAHIAHASPLSYAHAAPIAQYAAPLAHYAHATPVIKAVHQEVYANAHPHYSFNYGVQDGHTGDIKNQHEERDGDVVKGVYSLVQPDGITRTVHYAADHHNGFNAEVSYSGHAAHPQIVQKAVVAAPVYHQAPVYSNYHH